MRVTFFWSNGFHQSQYDRREISFPTATAGLPPPPRAFLYEHFRQAVLANMRGAGAIPDLDFDKDEDARDMGRLEGGDGKEWLETVFADQLMEDAEDSEDSEDVVNAVHREDLKDLKDAVGCGSCRRSAGCNGGCGGSDSEGTVVGRL